MTDNKSFKKAGLLILVLLMSIGAFSLVVFADNGDLPLVNDAAGILTDDQVDRLEEHLQKISDRNDFDVVVLTVPSLDGRVAHEYAADYFELNGYGRGNNDGCILVVAMEDRDFGFAALGFGNTAFTPVGQQYFDGYYLQHLRDNNYFEAFMAYGEAVDLFLKAAKAGTPYDENNIPGQTQKPEEEPKSKRGLFGGISIVLAALIAKITTGSWKSQLKSVRPERGARSYVRKDSLNLTDKQDVFLYRHIDTTIIPKKEEGSMGQDFTTSSGSKATGHSGKF